MPALLYAERMIIPHSPTSFLVWPQVSFEGVAKYTQSHTGKAGFGTSRGNSILVKLIVLM
jgi:hypothetical protein